MTTPTRPGQGFALGATLDSQGVNFAVFSDVAAYGGSVQLCLLDDAGAETPVAMYTDQDIWHAYVPDVKSGQRYGYRVDGPRDPGRGLLYDRSQLLLDPYAKALEPAGAAQPRQLRSLVVDTVFDWGGDQPPVTAGSDGFVYEAHVKGLTIQQPAVPSAQRGSYSGLANPAVTSHLASLGVTAVELMPVQQFLPEQFVLDRGLTDYWGYSTIGFFAPHAAYSSTGTGGQQVAEFKSMVKALHAAGLEVYLDVVYNHTAEGPVDAPALSFRGLANATYYRLDPSNPGRYVDVTGTNNSLNTGAREVLRLILDSLRYWVQEMHVDGFRFDLAAELARQHGDFDRISAFFDIVYQDPVLSKVRLIAEPWDVGPGGYEVGQFPAGWSEWNDHFRDQVRDFWAQRGGVANMGYRLTGSSDLYAARRGPDASVNYVVSHDGKTLSDLVAYEQKYNQANGENNADGTSDDHAFNCGVEGPTNDPAIQGMRRRQRRNLLATLLFAQGLPMLCGGDELGRTQQGNNNAYCQDNATSWYDWSASQQASDLSAFVQRAASLRRSHSALRRRTFLTGAGTPRPDSMWLDLAGQPMTTEQWQDGSIHGVALVLTGEHADSYAQDGSVLLDDDVLLVLNAGTDPAEFQFPGSAQTWTIQLDTSSEDGAGTSTFAAGATTQVSPATFLMVTAPRPS